MTVTWHVYQFRSETGELLYVGYTRRLKCRISAHRAEKSWWPEVTDIASEEFGTEDEARQREKAIWAAESPKYNRRSPFLTDLELREAERKRTQTPGYRAWRRAYERSPERQAYQRAYKQRPEYREAEREAARKRRQTPEGQAYMRTYRRRSAVRRWQQEGPGLF